MKSRIFLPGFILLFAFSTFTTMAASVTPVTEPLGKPGIDNMTTAQKEARMTEMKERVKEIKAMDKSHLTREQRKALRMELRSMNKEARRYGYTGVYISLGALIIIILLLILILK